ncbi:phage recombination protein Bet [Frigoribacterium sp. PhB107]|uniref:phage recombination protein Bet n=1 Tax=Frigoribacterium sp. PhB107 TaxID=2485172 RepID=UPI000F4A2C63|nr:phage recombination protein Bet [Frigoribacterium sp. PhB107]ROP78299.1 phage recombination protein Bet [Frigoribacterium sp. PhB107]
MTGTTVVALPASGDSSNWTASESALVEAAGLVTGPPNDRRLAPRPVVEAFLLHARRTGLDPIARQIYCIERKGRWGTQVSIDGARLVAERTKEYRGQTPTQWTTDGVTWVDVWLDSKPPKAARVGVYREGFVEPLVAVATMDAYNAGGPMWTKMPALMLGKCAEMLALRKAFPQDLSGLYSTEEMDQAGQPKQAAQVAAQPALVEAPAAEPSGRNWLAEARTKVSTAEINALWAEVPEHERSQKLLADLRAVGVALAQEAAAEPPSPEPEKPWAPQGEPAGAEWVTAEIPKDDQVRPGEEETPPLEGMEPEAPLTGGDDRG